MKSREIFTVDCETDPFKFDRVPEPFIWGAYNGVDYWEFNTTKEFINFIIERDCIVYAHNGGKFDWHFILEYLTPFSDCQIISSRLAKFQIGLAEFRDSYNILPFPLSKYKKDEFDYTKMEIEVRHLHMEEIKKYLKNDCVYLYEIVERFIADYGLNLTLAGAALKTWQKIAKVKAPKTSASYYNRLAPFYYGGRVECFEVGLINKDFNVIDINSAYPWAMKQKHPYGAKPFITDQLPDSGVEQCFIKLSCISCGALPYREEDGSLRFPRDDEKRTYFITGWEYVAGMKNNALSDVEILEVVVFSDEIDFCDYIDHFYALKSEAKEKGDDAGYIFSKLFLNSLYGKFGSNPDKYKKYMFVQPRYIEAAEQDGYKFGGSVSKWYLAQKPLEEEEQRYYDIAVAASITGCVRAYMFDSMAQCKGLIYCDTDSIAAVDSSALDYHPSKLGAWDIEAECDRGGVAGKKMYAFHDKNNGKWKTATKGVRLNKDEILQVCAGEVVNYQNEAPTFSVRKNPTFIERKVAFNGKTE